MVNLDLNLRYSSVEGKSRSPSIACLYLMTITGTPWSDTVNSLRGIRTHVDPNFAFQRQLKHFYDKLMVQVNIIDIFRTNGKEFDI